MSAVTALRVRLLGGFEVEGVETRQLGSKKARVVLKVLALARSKPVAADRLIESMHKRLRRQFDPRKENRQVRVGIQPPGRHKGR